MFTQVRQGKLSIRPSKCSVGYASLSFLGFNVSCLGLQPTKQNVDEILKAPRPITKTQLRSFIGLISFYRQFVPNFSAIAAPLTDLTKKGSPNVLIWNTAQELAFCSLRDCVAKQPILRLPNYNNSMILQTDASQDGLGSVVLQEEDGVRHPISFASRKLLPREKNYSTIEKECLAIIWSILKFQKYLYGQNFFLEVDHEPLQYLSRSNYSNGRLMRWALAIQTYRFTVRYIRG